MRRRFLAACLLGLGWSALVPAAGNDALARCVALSEDAARLACYDALFRDGAVRIETTTAAAPAAPTLTPEQGFGLGKRERAAPEPTEPAEIRAAIIGTEWRDQGRLLVLRLGNGQIWQQTERLTLPTVHSGDTVVIERAMLGSYLARLNGRAPSFRIKRLK
jgi:hypothetical protein